MSFWAELSRRNVFRVAAAYLVAAWVVMQVVTLVTEPLGLPDSLDTIVIALLAIGFPLALIVAWVYEVTPEGVRSTAELDASGSARHQSTQRLTYVIVALLVTAVGLMALDTFFLDNAVIAPEPMANTENAATSEQSSTSESAAPEDESDATDAPLTLVVLPFDDDSQAGDQQYLADGIAAEIRSTLSLVDGLSVFGPETSSFFKRQETDTRSMRDDWDVHYVLAGSVRSADDQLRITVTLTDTDTGTIAHNETYERVLDELFPLQTEIAEAVGRAMEITLGVGELGGRLGGTTNVEAFEEFLQGNRTRYVVPGVRQNIAHLERAVALDESFSLAWHALYFNSLMLDLLLEPQGGDPAALARADEAMSRVLELTPDLPEIVLLDVMMNPGSDIFEMARRFDQFASRAAENDYPLAATAQAEALLLFGTGRVTEAVAVLERARATDPFNQFVVQTLVEGYASQGRWQDSLALAREFAEQTGTFSVEIVGRAVYTALESGDDEVLARALAVWQASEAPGQNTALIRRMAELIDEPELALEELEAIVESGERWLFWDIHAAPWAAYFGDQELALRILEEAGGPAIYANVPRPLFAELRQTEEFKEFVRARGLEPYWRETGNWPDYCRPLGLNDFECF